MGRLEDIKERNKQPFRLKGSRSLLIRGLFLLLILGLFLFSNLGKQPEDTRPGINVVPAKDPAVRDVKLYKVPAKK
ncbi:MAG: hypothetical protein M4D80_39280 [Myxococcota bacterium]|nr:hypothetical protein [Myxococcota bacterium]